MFGHRYFGRRYFSNHYWGDGGSLPPPPPVITQNSGGYFEHGKRRHVYADLVHPPTKKEIRRQREEYRILPRIAEVIERVAERQASEPAESRLDDEQRIQELARELQAQDIAYESRYLEMLTAERERLVTVELGRLAILAKQAIEADNARKLLLMMLIL